jgi:hypothetical protein
MTPQNFYIKNISRFFIIILFAIVIIDCDKNSTKPEQPAIRGDIINTTSLNVYTSDDIEQIMSGNNIPLIYKPSYSVEVVRIIYQTSDSHGNNIQASGAIMIPVDGSELPLLSLHHGTVTKRDRVASVSALNSTEGMVGLIMASLGYFTCVPDYPGFGVSQVLHPYIHAKSLSMAVIDFLKAVKFYCANNEISLNGQLFLTGYSEGGYATLAAHKEIEQNYADEFNITAAAPMAGPYDLAGTVELILQQSIYNSPAYIAFILTAYNDIYKWNRLNEIFNPPYGDMMPNLFDGTKSFGEVNSQLPVKISDLLKQNFIDDYLSGNSTEFISAIEENSLLNWTPIAPLRFYHGDADVTVPYQNALTIAENLRANGATDIELITLSGKDHDTAGPLAIFSVIGWFNSFRNDNLF